MKRHIIHIILCIALIHSSCSIFRNHPMTVDYAAKANYHIYLDINNDAELMKTVMDTCINIHMYDSWEMVEETEKIISLVIRYLQIDSNTCNELLKALYKMEAVKVKRVECL